MKILVVLAHPDIGSFNHAIAAKVRDTLLQDGHQVVFHDLYAEKFEPELPAREIPRIADLPPTIQQQCRELAEAEGLVFIHPNWWGMPPAVLKGWIDRIVRPDVAYRFLEDDKGEGVPVGLLKAKSALIFNTSNTAIERERDVFKDPLETLWKNCILGLCGVTNVYRRMFCVVVTSSQKQREEWLEEAMQTTRQYYPPDEERS